LRLSYFPTLWKFSQIIMFAKPDKPPDLPTSYRPISLLPYFSKIYERLILKRIYPHIIAKNVLPSSQFGFRAKHSTVHQVHRITLSSGVKLEWEYTSENRPFRVGFYKASLLSYLPPVHWLICGTHRMLFHYMSILTHSNSKNHYRLLQYVMYHTSISRYDQYVHIIHNIRYIMYICTSPWHVIFHIDYILVYFDWLYF